MLQLSRAALICTETPESLAAMRRSFDEHQAIHLPGFLHPELLAFVQQSVRNATFYERDDEDIAREACMADNAMLAMMCLIANDVPLFDLVRRLTGCAPIGYFSGRVYAMRSSDGHFDRWHSDMSNDRLIGISVNLSEVPFEGGTFELRRVTSDVAEWSIANNLPGDAFLFRISDNLRHRVTPVIGSAPRVAYAGWFQGGTDLLTFLKSGRKSAENVAESMRYTGAATTK